MDAVCIKGDWDVALELDPNGDLLGVLVYHIRKYRGLTLILQPPMTAYNGIFLFYPHGTKGHTKISYQNKTTMALMAQLPKVSLYYQQHHPSLNNWLSLYWNKFKQTTRYTYILNKTLGQEALYQKLKGSMRRSFKHTTAACTIETMNDFDAFWPILKKSFDDRKKPVPYNKEVLRNLFTTFSKSQQLCVKVCKETLTGNYLSGLVMFSDKITTYNVASFHYKNTGTKNSFQFLIWKSIFECQSDYFDLEGSMIKEVEFFLRAFGGTLTPHYKIHKVYNPLLKIALSMSKPDFFD